MLASPAFAGLSSVGLRSPNLPASAIRSSSPNSADLPCASSRGSPGTCPVPPRRMGRIFVRSRFRPTIGARAPVGSAHCRFPRPPTRQLDHPFRTIRCAGAHLPVRARFSGRFLDLAGPRRYIAPETSIPSSLTARHQGRGSRQDPGGSKSGGKSSMSGVNEIRQAFIDYFKRNGHESVSSSPLVPRNDPTLMFTNAGMVQFKNVFTGLEKRPYSRAVTAQKCVRAGGKHNDLDNVGYTARHHTFFEMLGNFSFGDYFKERAIELAWNLVTKEFGLPKDKLTATVYIDDDVAFDLWKKIAGLPESRIIRIAGSDNFWAMGDTGPCGPCSEIFYDHGEHIPGGPPGSPDQDGDRFIEIWNLVFMQYEQLPDGKRLELPKPSIDTGMGLERIAAVLQGTHDNYSIDLFRAIIQAIADLTHVSPDGPQKASHRVIADHLRASSLPDRRRRAAVERRSRLCAPPHHAPRHAPCRIARRARAAAVEAGARAGARDGPGLSGTASRGSADHRNAQARRKPLPQDAGARAVDPRRRGEVAEVGRRAEGRHRVHALRHLRLSARSDAGRFAPARHFGRCHGLQRRHGKAARKGARFLVGLRRCRDRNHLVSAARKARRHRVSGLRDRKRRRRGRGAGSRRQGSGRTEIRRDRFGGAEPDAVLWRIRRPGRRYRHHERRGRALSRHRHPEEGRRPVRA